jgi:predicted phosphodiesterase
MATVLSDLSRQSNGKYHINDPIITKKFRQTAEQLYKAEKFDIWVAGHSHCEDNYHSENGFKYFNNGFVQNTKKFFYFDGQQGSLEKLFSSMGKF